MVEPAYKRLRNDDGRYGAIAQGLHWLIAALVGALFAIGWFMTSLPPSPDTIKVFNLHKSIGVAVLALMLLRVGWRLLSPPPPLPSSMSWIAQCAAKLCHLALYLLLFAQPLVGLLHSGAANFPVVVFGLFTLPALGVPDDALKQRLEDVHGLLAWITLVVIALHVGAALRHHLLLKDGVLRRMLPWGSS
ncbi:cytochrome b [Rhizobium aegyptiacum]|uniref:cytochrome b n=1 Tax=Rhizobium aegyptiacum TaxID=1764550 RepID=UPI0007E53394|nr:cytochrome b [Rhizobium aegyptiacum]